MNILITGAFGFVGANLSRALAATGKHRLIALDLFQLVAQSPPAEYYPVYSEFVSWDELHTLNGRNIDAIIHLAGKAHDTRHTAAEQEYFDINLGLTQKIYEFFLQSGAKKFIFFSSVKAAADTVQGEYLTETAEPSPGTPYGRSKLAAENYLLENHKQQTTNNPDEISSRRRISRGKPGTQNSEPVERSEIPPGGKTLNSEPGTLNSELRTRNPEPATSNQLKRSGNPESSGQPATCNSLFILRPAMIHGPGNKGNLNLLYRAVSKGIPWPLGAFENRRSFTSIANLNFIVGQLLEKDIEPGTYHVADDEPLSSNRLVQLIVESRGKKARIWQLNPRFISVIVRLGGKLHLPINSERLKKLTESYVVSNTKLKKALGIETLPVSAEEGMKETLESFFHQLR